MLTRLQHSQSKAGTEKQLLRLKRDVSRARLSAVRLHLDQGHRALEDARAQLAYTRGTTRSLDPAFDAVERVGGVLERAVRVLNEQVRGL